MAIDGTDNMNEFDPNGIGHFISAGGLLGWMLAVIGVVTPIVGLFGAVVAIGYYLTMWYESDTAQSFFTRRRAAKLARKVASLERQQASIIGQLKSLGVLNHAESTTVASKTHGAAGATTTTVMTTTLPPKV